MLVVLVGLDGNAGQGRIAGDVHGLPQGAVAGAEPVPEQGGQLNLAAGGGEGIEVLVMDVDVALRVGMGKAGVQHIHVVELLRALGTKLEHGAHGGVAVDVGVLPLDVRVPGVLEADVLENLHQAGVHLPHPAALGAIKDVRLGGADEALFDEHPLHGVLHLFHGGHAADVFVVLQFLNDPLGQLLGGLGALGAAAGLKGLHNGRLDLRRIKGYGAAVPLLDALHGHAGILPLLAITYQKHNRLLTYVLLHTIYSVSKSANAFIIGASLPLVNSISGRKAAKARKYRS